MHRSIKGIVWVGYICVLLIIAEWILRTFFPTPSVAIKDVPPLSYKLSTNKILGYELRPGIDDTNSDGIRDNEHTVEKPPGVTRIMVVGDSIAYGMGIIQRDETYAKQLEHLLRDTSKKYEVINLGIRGYGTAQILEFFKTKGLKYKPDIVIYGYWFDDFTKHGSCFCEYPFFDSVYAEVWETYAVCAAKIVWVKKIRSFVLNLELFRRSVYFISFLRHQFFSFRKDAAPRTEFTTEQTARYIYWWNLFNQQCAPYLGNIAPSATATEFQEYLGAFTELKEICDQNSIRMIVLMTPVLSDFSHYQYISLHSYISELAKSMNCEVVDTLRDFSQFRFEDFLTSPDDSCHFNQKGHSLVAHVLAQYLF
jgi:lysophospholipase L1-like esterase